MYFCTYKSIEYSSRNLTKKIETIFYVLSSFFYLKIPHFCVCFTLDHVTVFLGKTIVLCIWFVSCINGSRLAPCYISKEQLRALTLVILINIASKNIWLVSNNYLWWKCRGHCHLVALANIEII